MIENQLPEPEFVKEQPGPPARVTNPAIRFLGGLKLGLTVLALILIASTVGEFLPHEDPNNPMGKGMSLKLVFHTWWFQSLLFIMGVNLVLNTIMTYIDETRTQFLPFLRKKADHYKPLKVQTKHKFNKTKIEDPAELNKSLCAAMRERGYRTFYDGEGIYAHRGLIARFGSSVTHLGLIIIIIGALVESNFKIDGTVSLLEEETTDSYYINNDSSKTFPLGFDVTVHDFEFTNYPGTQTASKYKSTVTFQPKDGKPRHDFVRVNNDVTYNKWTFHQTSFQPLEDGKYMDRYYVGLVEKTEGGRKLHPFEIYVDPRGPSVKPIPGRDDRFFAVEPDGQDVIWTVTDKEKTLARGRKSTNELTLELRRFIPDSASPEAPHTGITNAADMKSPAALIEVHSNNQVEYRQWAGKPGVITEPNGSGIQFVVRDVELLPAASAGSEGSNAAPLEERVAVNVMLYHQGKPTGRMWTLRKGEAQKMGGATDESFNIKGDYELETFAQIPAYITHLSVSRNPGIPIVWLGAIFASLGPFLAFFVSRRRVWTALDWSKKTLLVGGESRYSREALEDEISEILEQWSTSPEVGMDPPLKMPRPEERPKLSLSL